MLSQPAKLVMTSCKAKAIPAPANPKAMPIFPNLSLKTNNKAAINRMYPKIPVALRALYLSFESVSLFDIVFFVK